MLFKAWEIWQGQGCHWVCHKKGEKIKSLRYTWNKATKEIGLKDMLFHDFRRTGVRNMVRDGVSENVAMTISGHKTKAVFGRYNIVSETDLKSAAQKMMNYLEPAPNPALESKKTS